MRREQSGVEQRSRRTLISTTTPRPPAGRSASRRRW